MLQDTLFLLSRYIYTVMMAYDNGKDSLEKIDVSSGNRTHDPSVTCSTAIPLRHRDNPTGNGASLWFCGILAEGVPIVLILMCLYGLIGDPIKDAS